MYAPTPSPSALVGRDRELSILRERRASARDGRGSLVLIGGEAGIGKTALADALCREAATEGAHVLIGHCYDLSETPPYGPWLDLFARAHPPDGVTLPDAFAQRDTIGAVASQSALFQQVLDFLSALSTQRAVVLLLDDLHWADPASLDLLRFLARTTAPLSVLFLVTYRMDELTRGDPLYALLPLLVREAHADRLDLRPLDADALHALLARRYRLDPADTARLSGYLQQRAEGNPFFLGELLRALEEERTLSPTDDAWALGDLGNVRLPPLLRQVIDGRLARLGEEGQGLLAIAAVIGHEVPLDVWSSIAECDEGVLLALAERGLDARLLSEGSGGDRVRFAHALIREALYERLSALRRRGLHGRVGAVLAASRSPDPDAVAYHFQRAEDERALPWLLAAGERARTAYAWSTAVVRFEAALRLMARTDDHAGKRGWLSLQAAFMISLVDVVKARALAEEAMALAGLANDRALAAFARYRCGMFDCFAGNVARGVPEVEAASNELAALSEAERAHLIANTPGLGPTSMRVDTRGTVVMWRSYIGPFPEVRALGERLVPEIEAGDAAVKLKLTEGFWGLAMTYALLGMPDEAAAMFVTTHDGMLRMNHHAMVSLTMMLNLEMVALTYRAEDIAGRRGLAERSEAAWTRARAVVSDEIPRRFARLSLLVLEGEWAEAERIASAVSGTERGLIHYRMMARRQLATIARLRGDAERAWRAVGDGLPAGSTTEPRTVWPFDVVTALQRIAAALALDDDDFSAAKSWLDAHDHWMAWSGAVLGLAEGQTLWAQYYRQTGDTERAYRHAQQAATDATAPRQPLALLAACRLLGELDTDAGRHYASAAHLQKSLALANACAAPYERALTLLALTALQIATNTRAEAQTSLEEIRTICTPLGAKPALTRADALAARLAEQKEVRPAYPAGLSAREVEVLRLVADGLTNAQVAERLFLSPHTINAHLTTIYAKLDVPSRAAAIRFALDHGLR